MDAGRCFSHSAGVITRDVISLEVHGVVKRSPGTPSVHVTPALLSQWLVSCISSKYLTYVNIEQAFFSFVTTRLLFPPK